MNIIQRGSPKAHLPSVQSKGSGRTALGGSRWEALLAYLRTGIQPPDDKPAFEACTQRSPKKQGPTQTAVVRRGTEHRRLMGADSPVNRREQKDWPWRETGTQIPTIQPRPRATQRPKFRR